jgi:hypothetical protein
VDEEAVNILVRAGDIGACGIRRDEDGIAQPEAEAECGFGAGYQGDEHQ